MTRSRDLILQELARESAGLAGLERSRDEARARIEFLRSELATASFAAPIALPLPPPVDVNTARTSAEKVKLFRSLFRGREDIFPTRFVSKKTGKPGYAPACSNKWEPARSGNGAHAWFFFAAPVSANVARRMGCYLVTETMNRQHELSMESYDRLFPNQDTMPRGGFGNLIALPLQYEPRQKGNSVFIDEQFEPIADQWAFLASLQRIEPGTAEVIAREALPHRPARVQHVDCRPSEAAP